MLSNSFTGKSALVTGASRGIGAATALAFARHGAERVVIHYGSYEEGARRVVEQIQAAGARAEAIQADLGAEDGIRNFTAELRRRGWAFDILVNNAGSLVGRASLIEFTEELYDRVFNLNVKSVWFITQAVAPAMLAKRSGVIVNVSSIAARTGGGPGAAVYSAAKAAVSSFTKSWAKELAPHGIRVNAVSPGTVDNHFHEQFSTREMLDNVIKATPAGRLGTNEEVASAILFLAGEGARYIHGQTIEINGGMFMV